MKMNLQPSKWGMMRESNVPLVISLCMRVKPRPSNYPCRWHAEETLKEVDGRRKPSKQWNACKSVIKTLSVKLELFLLGTLFFSMWKDIKSCCSGIIAAQLNKTELCPTSNWPSGHWYRKAHAVLPVTFHPKQTMELNDCGVCENVTSPALLHCTCVHARNTQKHRTC